MSGYLFFLAALILALLGFTRSERLIDAVDFVACGWTLIVLLIGDLRYWYVPRFFALVAITISLGLGLCGASVDALTRLIGVISAFAFLWSLLIALTWIMRRTSRLALDDFVMGAGDPTLLAVIGGFLGYLPLPNILFLGSFQALSAYFILSLCGSKKFQPDWGRGKLQVVPFGAFLCLAALELITFPELPSLLRTLLFPA